MTDTTKTEALRLEDELFMRVEDAASQAMTDAYAAGKVAHKPGIHMQSIKSAAELARAFAALKQQISAERDRLAAECEALRADAERYRWLRSSEDPFLEDLQWQLVRDYGDEYLDAQIDAAMGGKESQGGQCFGAGAAMKHTPATDAIILAAGPNVDRIRAAMRLAGHDITRRAAGDRWRALQKAKPC